MKNIFCLLILISCLSFSQDTNSLVDENASKETQNLFRNLKKLAQTKQTLVGQQDAFNSYYFDIGGKSDIQKTTGQNPAILGLDFAFITSDENNEKEDNWFYQQELKIHKDAVQAYEQGMLVTFCWHLPEPFEGKSFYTSEMTNFQKENALKSILPGGKNHDYYKKKLDKIASFLLQLKSKKTTIPVVFRPFHELDGNWFWWGSNYCSAEEYKQIWQFTVTYLRDTKSVHSILYAFSPDCTYETKEQYLERYPGDNYVDILGIDDYEDFNQKGLEGVKKAQEKLKMLSDIALERNKIAALTETGYRITFTNSPINGFFSENIYNAIKGSDSSIAYIMFWTNTKDGYYVPQPNMPDTQDFILFTKNKGIILQNDLPKLYQ